MNADSDNKNSKEGKPKPTKPTLISIIKDIAKVSVLIFALLVVGWLLLSM